MSDQRSYNRQLVEEFRASRNAQGGPMDGRPLLLLTTVGAKSGERHTTPMMAIRDSGHLVVVASNAGAPNHPNWYRNLVVNPIVTVEIGAETFDAVARVMKGADRQHLWNNITERFPFFAEHQAKISREIPLVVLERVAD